MTNTAAESADDLRVHLLQRDSTSRAVTASQIESVITAAQIHSFISAALTCVEQRSSQSAGGCGSAGLWHRLTNEERYAAVCFHGESVVEVSIQVAH